MKLRLPTILYCNRHALTGIFRASYKFIEVFKSGKK